MEVDKYDETIEDDESILLNETDVKRKLLDSFPDSSALLVYLRLRPIKSDALPTVCSCLQVLDSTTVLAAPSSADPANQKKFTFSEVFTSTSTQEQVFETTALGLIDNVINGKNVLIFAYGPTSSGKTYTMQGTFEHPGIIPRTLERLFKVIGSRTTDNPSLKPEYFGSVVRLNKKEVTQVLKTKSELLAHHKQKEMGSFSTFVLSEASQDSGSDVLSESIQSEEVSFAVWLSFYEIYNENVYDLLATKKVQKRPCLKVGQDMLKHTYIKGLCEVPVVSADEAYALLCVAKSNLHTAETFLNRSSSRSHSCFNIRLVQYSGEEGDEDCSLSTLTLCDLAGSERSTTAGTFGGALREAGRINNSLMVLSRCLESLRNSKNSSSENLVPFRESKLTQIMQPFFTDGIVTMVLNVNPDIIMAKESFQALKLSAIACEVLPSLSKSSSRFQESYSRLTELWQKSSRHWSSIGIGRADGAAVASPEEEFGSNEVEELFETIRILTEEREKAENEVARRKEMCAAYEKYIDSLRKNFQELEEVQKKSMERRIKLARESARLELYDEAEAESNLDLLRQLDEASEIIDNLQLKLETGKTNVVDHENLAKKLAEVETAKEQCENKYQEDLKALRAEYEEKAASTASALALKEKLLEDACSEAKRLKLQIEVQEREQMSTDSRVAQNLEELQKSLQEKDNRIETIQTQFENFRKESARKLEHLEQESADAQLLHEKDIWVMRTQLKMKDEAMKCLTEELNKERRLREEQQLTQANQVQQEVCQGGLELLQNVAESSSGKVEVQGERERQQDEESSDSSGNDTPAEELNSKEHLCCVNNTEMPDGIAQTETCSYAEFCELKANSEAAIAKIQLAKDASDQALLVRNTEIETLTTKLQQTAEELAKLQESVKLMASMREEHEVLHQRCENLLKDIAMKSNHIEKLELEKCEEQQKRMTLESSLNSATDEITSLHAELEQQHKHQTKIEAELEHIVLELKVVQAKCNDLEAQQEKVDEMQLAVDEVKKLQWEQRSLQEHLAKKDAEIQELHAAVERACDQAKTLQDEVTGTASSREQIKLQLDQLQMQYDELLVQQTNISSSLHEAQKERTALEVALMDAKEELRKAYVDTKQQQAQHMKDQEEQKRTEYALEKLQAECEALRAEQNKAHIQLNELELHLQCARDSANAQNEARMAAEERVCQREEEINNLREALERKSNKLVHRSSSSSLNGTEQENCDVESKVVSRKRRTQRQTHVKSTEENEAEFKAPRRCTRAMVAASTHKDDETCQKVTPSRKSVLVEQNADSSSPLKRLGNYLVGMLPGSASDEDGKEQQSSAKRRRGRKPLLSCDADSFFYAESEGSKTEERRPARRSSRRK